MAKDVLWWEKLKIINKMPELSMNFPVPLILVSHIIVGKLLTHNSALGFYSLELCRHTARRALFICHLQNNMVMVFALNVEVGAS